MMSLGKANKPTRQRPGQVTFFFVKLDKREIFLISNVYYAELIK